MPLYDFQCSEGHKFERHVPLADFEALQHCTCGAPSQRLISRPMFRVDQTGYSCPITGDWIGSSTAHRENLAKHDCRVLETGETEAATRYRQSQDEALDRAVEETVEREIDAMPSDKREKLYNEMVASDVAITRQSPSA